MENIINVVIHTDGACSGNPGNGGWAAILECMGHEKEISGGIHHTTNNRMELMAAIKAIDAIKKPCVVTMYTDSSYLRDNYPRVPAWIERGWKTTTKKKIMNIDLWKALVDTVNRAGCELIIEKVPGHAGVPQNERCDRLARAAILKLDIEDFAAM